MKQVLTNSQLAETKATLLQDLISFGAQAGVKVFTFDATLIPLLIAISLSDMELNIVDSADKAEIAVTTIGSENAVTELTVANHDIPLIYVDKTGYIFKWEEPANTAATLLAPVISEMLVHIADDPAREGLAETPMRVAKAWQTWTSGYTQDAAEILKSFEDGAENCDEMVIVKDIPIYSKCEHHLADIFGTATIAYIPNGRVVGLSKLSRLANMFARRLQVQERLTNQIADALETNLDAKGVAVLIRARHMCMESRGLCQQGHHTITSALRGVIKEDHKVRDEFISLANSPATP